MIASPPSPQPKHLNVPRAGETVKLGVRSWWKGQRPLYVLPALRRRTTSSTSGRISIVALTRSTDSSLIRATSSPSSAGVGEREAVGHPGEVVGRGLGVHPALVDELLEDPPHRDPCRAVILGVVHALEHEGAEREHRVADLVALDDVARACRALDDVVDERVDAARARVAEQRDRLGRQVGRIEVPGADGVVDVVVDVREAVDEPDDPPLERLRLLGAGVLEDAVAHLPREVEAAAVALEPLDDAQRVLVVAEAAEAALAQQLVERLLAGVAERRVADVVPDRDRLGEVLVQAQRPRDPARDPGRLERVREPGAEVVALGIDEDLRLVAQAAERLRVDDAVAVALERRPQAAFLLGSLAPARLVRAHGERREPLLLVLANRVREAVRDLSGDLRHRPASLARSSGGGK